MTTGATFNGWSIGDLVRLPDPDQALADALARLAPGDADALAAWVRAELGERINATRSPAPLPLEVLP